MKIEYRAFLTAHRASSLASPATSARQITVRKKRKNQVPTYPAVVVGIHEEEKSRAEKLLVLKAISDMLIEELAEAVEVAIVVEVAMSMMGRCRSYLSFAGKMSMLKTCF